MHDDSPGIYALNGQSPVFTEWNGRREEASISAILSGLSRFAKTAGLVPSTGRLEQRLLVVNRVKSDDSGVGSLPCSPLQPSAFGCQVAADFKEPAPRRRTRDFEYRAAVAAARFLNNRERHIKPLERPAYIRLFRHTLIVSLQTRLNSRVGCYARRCCRLRCIRGRPSPRCRLCLRRGRGGGAAYGGPVSGGARRPGGATGSRGTAGAGGRLGRVRGPADTGRSRRFRPAAAERVPGLGRRRARAFANGRWQRNPRDRRPVLRHRRARARGRGRTDGPGQRGRG